MFGPCVPLLGHSIATMRRRSLNQASTTRRVWDETAKASWKWPK
jgi:hypothetical protein